jgi:hypothetical protein
MTGLVRKATLLCGAMLIVACVANAGVPNAANSPVPTGIQLGATTGGVVDPAAQVVITVRDASNNPVANSLVEVLLGNCYNDANADIKLCNTQPFPGLTFNCTGRVVAAVSDASGQATFRIVGDASAVLVGGLPSPGITTACGIVRADGTVINNGNPVYVGAYDLNGSGGVNGADLSLELNNVLNSPANYRARADLNGTGTCNGADLSLSLFVVLRPNSQVSCASNCL